CSFLVTSTCATTDDSSTRFSIRQGGDSSAFSDSLHHKIAPTRTRMQRHAALMHTILGLFDTFSVWSRNESSTHPMASNNHSFGFIHCTPPSLIISLVAF